MMLNVHCVPENMLAEVGKNGLAKAVKPCFAYRQVLPWISREVAFSPKYKKWVKKTNGKYERDFNKSHLFFLLTKICDIACVGCGYSASYVRSIVSHLEMSCVITVSDDIADMIFNPPIVDGGYSWHD